MRHQISKILDLDSNLCTVSALVCTNWPLPIMISIYIIVESTIWIGPRQIIGLGDVLENYLLTGLPTTVLSSKYASS